MMVGSTNAMEPESSLQAVSAKQRPNAFLDWVRWATRTPRVIASGGFILLLALAALAAPLITIGEPAQIRSGEQHRPPSLEFPLGTDEFGRDIYTRLIYGARITLIVSIVSVAIAAIVGTTLGMLSAHFGSPVDTILMRFADGILAFPGILLALFIIAFLGTSVVNIILVIGFLYIPRFQRVAYATTLSIQENDYIEAYRAIGARTGRILARGVLPNILAPIIVQISLAMGTAILLEAGLSFLGLGPPPSVPSWGRTIQQSSRFMNLSAYGVIWPAVIISATVLAFNILGDALRDRLDPRLRT
ncbi:MAG TPA: ABC transporter permease [Thermomicrobiales bacterium]|nr:ABC transporter permease [Thermomicrobiales bacterium]